jgi:hypothetical protein
VVLDREHAMSRTFSRLVVASSVLAAAPLARADGPIIFHGLELAEAPATMTVETDDGWRFEPGIADGQLVGLLGVYSGDGGTEASIRLAWFEPIGEGRWSGLGWQSEDEHSVAVYLADLFEAPTLFERGSLAGADLSAVAPADDPVTLHLGFDEADPWQPVLEVADANLVEVIVEAGGAGMPALAPMAMPVPVDGELCGSALEAGLNDIAGDYITAFGLDQQLSDETATPGGARACLIGASRGRPKCRLARSARRGRAGPRPLPSRPRTEHANARGPAPSSTLLEGSTGTAR